ncbi:MAG: YncE family protein [Abditibacteriales bacterium]|nr:YncE family protein [Abditibacteriales bacterium]
MIVLLCVACAASEIYVVNTLSRDVAVIDAQSDTVIATIPLNAHGYRVAFSPQGDKAYVTTAPSAMMMSAKAKADQEATQPQLVIIDTARRKVEASIRLNISAMANVHVHPNGRMVFIVTASETGKRNEERGRVIFLDVPSRRIVREVPVGLNPLDSVMTPDGSKLFVANYFSRDISVVNLDEGRLQDNIPLSISPVRTLAVRPDGKKVYVVQEKSSASGATDVRHYDLARQMQRRTLSRGEPPAMESTGLWEIDTATHNIEKFPFDGLTPVYALAVSPDGKRLYAHGRSATAIQTTIMGQQLAMRSSGIGGFGGGAGMPGMPGPAGPPGVPSPPGGARAAKSSPPASQPSERTDAAKEAAVLAQQQAAPATPAAPLSEPTELLVIDLNTKRIVQRISNLPFSTMAFSPDGKKLYLIGTPGNAEAEARANRLAYQQRVEQMDKSAGKIAPLRGEGQARRLQSVLPSDANELVEELSRLRKTVTVVDAQTGTVLKTLTVGSLPQGAATRITK